MADGFQPSAFQNDAFQMTVTSGPSTPLSSVPKTPTERTPLGGMLDQMLDPITLDYIDTADGEWLETADSRTLVMWMLEMRLGASYYAPRDGTRIRELIERGDPVTPEVVEAEYRRAMAVLEAAGVVADFAIRTRDDRGVPLVDEAGRFTPVLSWRDLATGTPVDLVYAPADGAGGG